MIDFDRLVFQPVLQTLGVPCTYTHAAEPPIACRILLSRPDRDWQSFQVGVTSQCTVGEIRVAEVPDASEGDTLEAGGETYVVTKASRPEVDRLMWTLELARRG